MNDAKYLKELLGNRAKDIIMSGLNQTEVHKKIICPFHSDKVPSMSWFEDGLLWKCMSTCGETMDIYRYYQEFENMTFKESVDKVAELVGETAMNTPVKKAPTKKIYAKATGNYKELSENAIKVALKRGIKQSTLEEWGVQSAQFYGSEWFVFRYKDNKGKITFNTYRQLNEKICQREKGTKEILWGIDHIDVNKPVIIVEGQFDAMVVYQCGYKNVVSIPSGINAKGWIENSWEWLETVDRFIIWSDSDEAGLNGAEEIKSRLGYDKTTIDYDSDYKDANDMLLGGGSEVVKDFIENLLSLKTEGLVNMGRRKTSNKEIFKFKCGFPELDRYFKYFKAGQLTIVAGRDNEGKSTFLSQMIASVLIDEKVFLYSGELTDDNIEQWIMQQMIGKKKNCIDKIYNEWHEAEYIPKPEVYKVIRKWYSDKFYTYENKIELEDNDRMFKVMAQAYKKHGIKIFFIDNLMSSINSLSNDSNGTETSFVKKCKDFALAYGVHVIVVAHPNKTGSFDHTPLEKVHVAGSKNITNIADNVIAVERAWKFDEDLNEIYTHKENDIHYTAIIRGLKNRVKRPRQDFFFRFDSDTARYFNDSTVSKVEYGWEKFMPLQINYEKIRGETQEKSPMD